MHDLNFKGQGCFESVVKPLSGSDLPKGAGRQACLAEGDDGVVTGERTSLVILRKIYPLTVKSGSILFPTATASRRISSKRASSASSVNFCVMKFTLAS